MKGLIIFYIKFNILFIDNTKICDKLLLSNPKIKYFGKEIQKYCEIDFKQLNSYGSKRECLNNLCTDCCKILDGDSNQKYLFFIFQKFFSLINNIY